MGQAFDERDQFPPVFFPFAKNHFHAQRVRRQREAPAGPPAHGIFFRHHDTFGIPTVFGDPLADFFGPTRMVGQAKCGGQCAPNCASIFSNALGFPIAETAITFFPRSSDSGTFFVREVKSNGGAHGGSQEARRWAAYALILPLLKPKAGPDPRSSSV